MPWGNWTVCNMALRPLLNDFFFTASKSCLISLFFNFFWRSALTSQTLWKLWLIINHSLTDFSPLIWSVIILVIKQIGLPVHSCLILLDTCTCIDCRSNWTPLSLTEIVKLHVICRTCNLEQIFSCWLIIILWQVQSKNRKEIYYQVQAVPWEATNAAKNLHILACKLDYSVLKPSTLHYMYVFFHKCLSSLLNACLQQVHDCISTC